MIACFGLEWQASLMGLIMSSGVQLPGIEFWDCHLLAVWSWAVALSLP